MLGDLSTTACVYGKTMQMLQCLAMFFPDIDLLAPPTRLQLD